jgi:outer membrane protein
MAQYEESTVKLDTKAKALQKEYETFQRDVMDFQRKVEANAFLSRERAESEQSRLQKKEQQLMSKQQDLENLRQKLSSDFMNEQAALTQQLQDSVQQYLREYNADGHLHLILNEAVLMNKVAGYDITDEVIEGLNARYKK